MRNKEEFKAELFRRRARYERQRKKRRNIYLQAGFRLPYVLSFAA